MGVLVCVSVKEAVFVSVTLATKVVDVDCMLVSDGVDEAVWRNVGLCGGGIIVRVVVADRAITKSVGVLRTAVVLSCLPNKMKIDTAMNTITKVNGKLMFRLVFKNVTFNTYLLIFRRTRNFLPQETYQAGSTFSADVTVNRRSFVPSAFMT